MVYSVLCLSISISAFAWVPVFLLLIKAAGNLCGDYPYSVVITSFLLYFLYTHPSDVLALPILY